MDQILNLSRNEQAQIFQEAAARSNEINSPIIIEKDFWVCWVLQEIFSIPKISPYITFKGGTSLSKCYSLINRFSEDCDLTLNKEFLGITETAETILNKSRKQRDKSIEMLSNAAKNMVNNTIKPLMIANIQSNLSDYYNEEEWRIEPDPEDSQSLLFYYPVSLPSNPSEYVKSAVKLEFGARGDNNPNELRNISPYIYNILPEIFIKTPSIPVHTLTAKRTFWEKVTLLHAEHHRKVDKPLQKRIFRHYYDIVMLDNHGITNQSLDDLNLLETVLMNKKIYFASPSAHYETARIGTMCLSPNDAFVDTLKQDCEKMSDMFFGEPPNYENIIERIGEIEKDINSHTQSY